MLLRKCPAMPPLSQWWIGEVPICRGWWWSERLFFSLELPWIVESPMHVLDTISFRWRSNCALTRFTRHKPTHVSHVEINVLSNWLLWQSVAPSKKPFLAKELSHFSSEKAVWSPSPGQVVQESVRGGLRNLVCNMGSVDSRRHEFGCSSSIRTCLVVCKTPNDLWLFEWHLGFRFRGCVSCLVNTQQRFSEDFRADEKPLVSPLLENSFPKCFAHCFSVPLKTPVNSLDQNLSNSFPGWHLLEIRAISGLKPG